MNNIIKETKAYIAPRVRAVSFNVERGFAGSGEFTPANGTGLEGLFHGGDGENDVNDNYNEFFTRPTH